MFHLSKTRYEWVVITEISRENLAKSSPLPLHRGVDNEKHNGNLFSFHCRWRTMISPGVSELTVDIKIQKSSGKVPRLKTVGSLRARKNRCLHTHAFTHATTTPMLSSEKNHKNNVTRDVWPTTKHFLFVRLHANGRDFYQMHFKHLKIYFMTAYRSVDIIGTSRLSNTSPDS